MSSSDFTYSSSSSLKLDEGQQSTRSCKDKGQDVNEHVDGRKTPKETEETNEIVDDKAPTEPTSTEASKASPKLESKAGDKYQHFVKDPLHKFTSSQIWKRHESTSHSVYSPHHPLLLSYENEQALWKTAEEFLLRPTSLFRWITYLYAERKLVVFFWVHFVTTIVIWGKETPNSHR